MWSLTETVTIEREAGNCSDSSDLRELLACYDDAYVRWHQYINRLVTESGLSYRQLSERSGLSKTTIRDWCARGSLPRRRESLIRLGFGLGMDRFQINRLLMYGGGFHGLYPRDVMDAACIFVLNQKKCIAEEGRNERETLDTFDYNMARELYRDVVETTDENDGGMMTTQMAMDRLLTVETRQDFFDFMGQLNSNSQGRSQLLSFLTEFINVRRTERSRQEDGPVSFHRLAESWGEDGELEKVMSCLKNHGMVPRRDQLITLGLRLGMNLSELNQILSYAGMEGLYARDKLECVLIYALQNLELRYPGIARENAFLMQDLARDPQLRNRCKALVEEYMEYNYRDEEADWTELSEYICRILEELELPEAQWLLEALK
ncbi:MAG: hypothetical protein IKD13_05475 [Firmicutes bacterium]|nr:hypothetical protein [Bacillota bacterium]